LKSLQRPSSLIRWLSLVLTFGGLVIGTVSSHVEAATGSNVRAQAEGQPITLSLHAGFDGYYKETRWMPVRIEVANDGPDVRGTLTIASPRSYGGEAIFTRQLELPTQSRREIFLYIPPEGTLTNLKVSLLNGKTELAVATARLVGASATDLIYGVLANSPSSFNNLVDVDPISGSAFVAQLEIADLPPVGQGWEALDVLVVSDMDMGSLSPEQHTALADWITGGGRLIVAGGPAWQKTAAGLSDLLPISPTAARTLNNFDALGTFAASAAPEGSAVAATGQKTADATILTQAGNVPLIVSRPLGFGQVTFLAIDPAFAPFKGWDGFEGLFSNILATPVERPNWADGFKDWSSASSAVNALPGLDLPSSFQICGFLGIYLVVAGPLNYLLLKRVKRRELAWLTVPGLALLFSGIAYLTGYQLRGAQATLHQLSIVQVWPDSDYAQVDELVGLVSPRRQSYTLQFTENFLARPLPADYTYTTTTGSLTLEQSDQTQIAGIRADIGAIKAFVAQGQVPAPRFDSQLTLDFSGNSPRLTGTVTNQSNLTLTDAVLLGPGGLMRLGDFPPGKSQNVSIPLLNMRATSVAQNNAAPVFPVIGGAKPLPYSPGSVSDSTIDDILGNTNYYNDKQAYRRYSLLAAAIQSYGGGSRGSGVYLAGWTSKAPVSAEVVNRSFVTEDVTLYLVSLPPTFNLGEGVFIIPPGLMTWAVVDPGQSGSPAPYDMSVYAGYTYALRFSPAHSMPFGQVTQLTLHLSSSSYGITGVAPVRIELWDFTENTWVEENPVIWGDNKISAPARFVSPAGEIQVRVTNPASAVSSVDLETLDFTLFVEE